MIRTTTPLWGAAALLLLLAMQFGGVCAPSYQASSMRPPSLNREMRGVWIASVGNIDWPSTNGLTTAQQEGELVAIFDRAAQLKLNTVILQVRPSCDALYASPLEPWSEYLTGTMGKAPEPYYDPLSFAVEEAHRRGLELHAWFNPFRARHLGAKSPIAANHVSKSHPELVRRYGKSLWLDPGEQGAQDYSLSVIMDVVKRYDIDGVHFDDYFYPYKESDASGREIEFPDETSWARYRAAGKLSRDDWRRQNINGFIRRVYQSIKASKPWVKFGVSPFGIWRPGNPAQIRGFDPYERLYADSRRWLVSGWVDYFAPQLYWSIDTPEQSFPVLLQWWAQQNPARRILAPGVDSANTMRVSKPWSTEEILRQIRLARRQPGVSGHLHWDAKALMRNGGLGAALQREIYADPTLPPAMRWVTAAGPRQPRPAVYGSEVTWEAGDPGRVWRWVVQQRTANSWRTEVLLGPTRSLSLGKPAPEIIAITAVDRYGNASRPAVLQVKK